MTFDIFTLALAMRTVHEMDMYGNAITSDSSSILPPKSVHLKMRQKAVGSESFKPNYEKAKGYDLLGRGGR